MAAEDGNPAVRFTCPPCGEVFAAMDDDQIITMAIEHARKFHDVDLLAQFSMDALR